jgi:hypothetical protein
MKAATVQPAKTFWIRGGLLIVFIAGCVAIFSGAEFTDIRI